MKPLTSLLLALALAPAARAQTTGPATQPAAPTTQAATTRAATTRATKQLYIDAGLHVPTMRARVPLGFLPAVVEGGGRFFGANGKEDSYWVGGYHGPNEHLVPGKVRFAVSNLPPGTLYAFDQERPSWSPDPRQVAPDVAAANVQRYRDFVLLAREGNPTIRLSVYGLLPIGDFWIVTRQYAARRAYEKWRSGAALTDDEKWAIGKAYTWDGTAYKLDDAIADGDGRASFLKWQRANDLHTYGTRADGTVDPDAGLTDAVDASTPSLYDFYPGDDTEGYVYEVIAEARRLADGRPVYPFVWPCYHDSNPTVGAQTIPLDEWRLHVRRVLRQADGCVLWGADPVRHRDHIRVLQEEAEAASREPSGK